MTEESCPTVTEYILEPEIEKVFNIFSGFMLVYVKSGQGVFCLNDKILDFVEGTTIIISCLDFLRKEKCDSVTHLMVLEFGDEIFSGRINEFFSIRSLPLCTVFTQETTPKPHTILQLLHSSMDCSLEKNDIFLRNLTKEILIYTIQSCGLHLINLPRDIKTELAILYIYTHFKESVTIEAVAAHIHYSVNYFYHSFQENTGITFRKFLHELRLNYAVNLIRYTDLSISDICYECGFNSVQYFSTTFREKFGQSPRNFINNINIKEK